MKTTIEIKVKAIDAGEPNHTMRYKGEIYLNWTRKDLEIAMKPARTIDYFLPENYR